MLSLLSWMVAGVGLALTWAVPAYAYIDAGSGSVFLQFLIAALLGGLYALKAYWKKVRTFLGRLFVHRGDAGSNE